MNFSLSFVLAFFLGLLPMIAAEIGDNCEIVANHTVVMGDTLGGIANATNTTIGQLLYVNKNITNQNFIETGTIVAIPDSDCEAPPAPTPPNPSATCVNGTNNQYVVVKGDTFTIISTEKLNITLQALEDANPDVEDFNVIEVGDILNVPLCVVTATCSNTKKPTYTVVKGDWLTRIANAKLGITLKALEDANPQIPDFDLIYPGDVLNVPLCKKEPPVTVYVTACPTTATTPTPSPTPTHYNDI